jgi:hypothetical protein
MEARTKINRNFIFEKRWIKEDDFLDMVRRSWTQNVVASNSLDILQKKLKNVKKCLKGWGANLRGIDIKKKEKDISLELKELEEIVENGNLSPHQRKRKILIQREL